MKWLKKHMTGIIFGLFFLVGLGLLLYPSFSDYYNSIHQSEMISNYSEAVGNLNQEEYTRLLEQAQAYNDDLPNQGFLWDLSEEQKKEYNEILNPEGSGMIGYIEIDSIDCMLPIYHGAEESILQNAVGHLPGSSFPIGGTTSHCVLSGHRGLPSAKLFSDLDKVEEGDHFVIRVLDEVFTYEVDQIRVVLPEELSTLELEEGKDYCTLVTCTPYGVNTHRLLVRGHRVPNSIEAIEAAIVPTAFMVDRRIIAVILTIAVLITMIIVVTVRDRIRSGARGTVKRGKE